MRARGRSRSTLAGVGFDALLEEAESRPVRGWDFTWLGARMTTEPLPWDFTEIVVRYARRSPDLLDLGTGGGEWLAGLAYRPPRTLATEAWPPNVAVADARLRSLGIAVVPCEAAPDNVDQLPAETRGRLPFPPESFSLVTSRNESFVGGEVARVLTTGGTFLTQQVGGDYGDFYEALELPRPAAPERRWNLHLATEQLEAAGLRVIESAEGAEVTSFADVGALAWYLRAIPWVVPGFSIEAHRPRLARLYERMRTTGSVEARLPAFWLAAVKRPAR